MPDTPLHTMPWKDDGSEELRISVNEFKGQHYFAARVWFQGKDSKWFPGKQGINVPIARAEEFSAAIARGVARIHALQKRDLLPPPAVRTSSEEQLQRESDERAALNERLEDARD